MNLLRQIGLMSRMNIRGIPARPGNSAVIVIGVAGVVAALICSLSMAEGFRAMVARSGKADRAIVLSRGSPSERASGIARGDLVVVADAPGVRKSADGKPLIAGEFLLSALVSRRSDGSDAYVAVRGMTMDPREIRPETKLVAGRMFKSGVTELIVGQNAQLQFSGLDLGEVVRFNGVNWSIVGVFSSDKDSRESELLGDANTLLTAVGANSFKSLEVQLESPDSLAQFRDAVTQNPSVTLDVWRETEYQAKLTGRFSALLRVLAYVVGGLMALGAFFGALNTMYSAVSSRTREIATVQAIGFRPIAVVISVIAESTLLALAGSALGIAVAFLFAHQKTVSTVVGGGGNSQLVFGLEISLQLVLVGAASAIVIGILGALPPALRATAKNLPNALAAR